MTPARSLCFAALLFAALAAAGGCTLIAGLPEYTLGTGGGDLDGGVDADGSGGGW